MLKRSGSLKRSGEHSNAWGSGPHWVAASMNAIGFIRQRSDEFILHIPNIPAADVLIEYGENFTTIVCEYFFHEMSLSEVRRTPLLARVRQILQYYKLVRCTGMPVLAIPVCAVCVCVCAYDGAPVCVCVCIACTHSVR